MALPHLRDRGDFDFGRWPDTVPRHTPEPSHLALVPPARRAADRRANTVVMSEVLAAWRAEERELARLSEGDPDWPVVETRVQSLRDTYHRLFDERIR